MDETEYRHLQEQCSVTGLSVSVLIRKLIAGVQLRPRPPGEYTKLLNARKSIHEAEIVDAVQLVRKAWELVKNGL